MCNTLELSIAHCLIACEICFYEKYLAVSQIVTSSKRKLAWSKFKHQNLQNFKNPLYTRIRRPYMFKLIHTLISAYKEWNNYALMHICSSIKPVCFFSVGMKICELHLRWNFRSHRRLKGIKILRSFSSVHSQRWLIFFFWLGNVEHIIWAIVNQIKQNELSGSNITKKIECCAYVCWNIFSI